MLAGVALLGHLPASELLDIGADASVEDVAEGSSRACFVGARPPGDVAGGWTVDALSGSLRGAAPSLGADGLLRGRACWVVDAPGADVLVVVAVRASDDAPVAVAVDAASPGVSVSGVMRYDATRSLGHVTFDGASGSCSRASARSSSRARGIWRRRC